MNGVDLPIKAVCSFYCIDHQSSFIEGSQTQPKHAVVNKTDKM